MKKCIKNYAINFNKIDYIELKKYLHKYNKCKNLFYNSYYNDIDILFNSKKWHIRNMIVKGLKDGTLSNDKYNLLKDIPAKLQKCALEESISDMKARWSNIKNRIKKDVNKHKKFDRHEKHYLYYILNSNNLISDLIKYNSVDINKFKNNKKLNHYILRKIRNCNSNKPFSKAESYMLDGSSQISYSRKNGRLFISIPSLIKRKRVHFELTSNQHIFNGMVKVVLKNNKIEFHKAIDVEKKENYNKNVISMYIDLEHFISVSSGNHYGKELKNKLLRYSKYIYTKNEKRNNLYRIKNNKIKKNNLGTKKQLKFKNRLQGEIESYINETINEIIKNEHIKTVVVIDINKFFLVNDINYFKSLPIKFRWRINNWLKYYIYERLEYKLNLNSINLVKVSPLHTTKVCHSCGSFDTRLIGRYFNCNHCGVSMRKITNTLNNIMNKYHNS